MIESPREVPQDGAVDDDLASLPAPPRRARTVSTSLMAVAGLLATMMAGLLAGDVRYALSAPTPVDVGDLGTLVPGPPLANKFVQGTGVARVERGLSYTRPLEPDTFLLSPIVGSSRIWVEMRSPGQPVARAAALPLSFVGRLLPVRGGGFRRGGVASSAHGPTPIEVPDDAWVLLDGVAPASLRWTVPLAALFAAFAAWCLLCIVKILRPVRSSSG
jgi:hypothetical protein